MNVRLVPPRSGKTRDYIIQLETKILELLNDKEVWEENWFNKCQHLEQQLQAYKDKEDKIRELVKDKLDEQTKTYQKILNEQQNEIDQLERNCDVFYEQMNDAVERTVELNKLLDEISNNLHFRYIDAILGKHGTELKNRLLKILERLG